MTTYMSLSLVPKTDKITNSGLTSTIGSTHLDVFSPLDFYKSRWNDIYNYFDAIATPTYSLTRQLNPFKFKDDTFTFETELPRFKADNLNISTENNLLHISAEQDSLKYYNSLTIPSDMDASTIEAKLDHGVLYITAKRKEESKPKKISVKTA